MDKTSPLYLFAAQRPWKASLSADEPLLVDYIVFLPQAYFEASILRENVTDTDHSFTGPPVAFNFSTHLELPIVDKATAFLKHCVQDAFYIDDSSPEFCKQALFTLTTGLNNGGAFCSCNAEGSKGYTCNPLGGQCDCKPNVIGRTCNACRSDYYAFPDCIPCNCPKTAAYCDPVSGECVCAKNVVGSDCAKCAPLTYGIDPKMGCKPCYCHPAGVKDRNIHCDPQFGTCDCKEKYDGRTCDSCKAGYFDFPVCRVCDCPFDGTTDICDRKSGTCYCKENVLRPNCDVCQRGTYNLEKNNPKGCTKCFCFGTTENCRSSEFKSVPIRATNYTNWSTVNIDFTESGERISFLEIESGPNESEYKINPRLFSRGDTSDVLPKADTLSNIYFKVPNEFLGNRLTSYGGFINYTILETSSSNAEDTVITPDIILIGRNYSIALTRDEQPGAPGISLKMEIELLESKFVHLTDSTLVSRPQFMTLLLDLQSIYIRAAYFKSMDSVTLTDFTIDSALDLPNINGSLASRVEQCICPPNYKGSSCEECVSGYYRVANGPYLGSCAPCQCNGHSNECDPLTGKCFNCKHETVGDHCELCKSGFYGNATVGTPHDCLMCPCPMPNNFAESCEVRQNARIQTEIVCNCKPGYSGQKCELCSAGHFGYPRGSYCQPCQCNGNIDPKDPGSCDMFSGECIKCLNNTAGRSCEYCADNYYGDAINLKNCKPCQCDPDNTTAVCDRYSGQCKCHPNFIGHQCEYCSAGFYNYPQCQSCDCNPLGITDDICNPENGQCKCKTGVEGDRCDKCKLGYYCSVES
ncbi:laminin subunit alpha-like [Panonychus citri]|uniref:laminin subunit alpha-like n=1 Tax=Panonychus citri TaxID=50023 RepID=UPI0023073BDE|nr:laminin subunit alpha-like [Panonychus citri]